MIIRFKIVLLVFILTLNFSCKSQFHSVELDNNFTKNQIEDFQKMTVLFQTQICKDDKESFKNCFEKNLPLLLENGSNIITAKIDYNKQRQLYTSISESTFNEIWDFCKTQYRNDERNYRTVCGKHQGKYQKFLKEVGQNNPHINDYYLSMISAGDFDNSGQLETAIYQFPNDFNLNDPNIQIILTIQYLTINDQENRKEIWQ